MLNIRLLRTVRMRSIVGAAAVIPMPSFLLLLDKILKSMMLGGCISKNIRAAKPPPRGICLAGHPRSCHTTLILIVG